MSENHANSMTLTSLVLLKQQIDSGKDYYDYLVPFIEQIYIEKPDGTFDANEIQGLMDSDFGLIIPQDVVRFVLRRMKGRKLIKEEFYKFSKGQKFKGKDLKDDKKNASDQINEVIEELQKFAKSLGRDNLSSEQAMEAIQRFLSKFQISCISTFIQDTALPSLSKIEHWDEGLVGLFVGDIVENNFPLFGKFMVLVQGNMLANALISTDTRTPPDTFRKTTFYFDTPNLLYALGYSGDDKQVLAKEMISLLKNLNGGIAVFKHSIEEAIGVITATAKNIDDLKFAQKTLNIVARQKRWTKSDLLIRAGKIESDLEDIGFQIKPTPNYNERFQIDEEKLKELLKSANVNVFEEQSIALNADINSIRSIYCLRRDKPSWRLEDTNAILVTSNSAFVRASYKYNQTHDSLKSYSPAINNFTLTNIAWLKSPNFAQNLIDAQAIALAYSAMRLPQSELEAFLKRVTSLVQEGKESYGDLQLLRSSEKFLTELASTKAAGNDLESEQTVSSVIGKVRAAYSAETDEAKSALQIEREKHRQTQEDLKELQKQKNERLQKRAKRCDTVRRIGGNLLIFAVFVIVLSYMVHPWAEPRSSIHNLTKPQYFILSSIVGVPLLWRVLVWTGKCNPLSNNRLIKRLIFFCNDKVNHED